MWNRAALPSQWLSLASRKMNDFYFLHCFSVFSKFSIVKIHWLCNQKKYYFQKTKYYIHRSAN